METARAAGFSVKRVEKVIIDVFFYFFFGYNPSAFSFMTVKPPLFNRTTKS